MASNSRSRGEYNGVDAQSLSGLERLLFAQAVYEYGAEAWSDIGKILSRHPLIHRGKNFFSAQNCSSIYAQLMNEAELQRPEDSDVKHAPVHLRLAQRQYHEQVGWLRNQISEAEVTFRALSAEIDEIRAGEWDENILSKLNKSARGYLKDTAVELRQTSSPARNYVENSDMETSKNQPHPEEPLQCGSAPAVEDTASGSFSRGRDVQGDVDRKLIEQNANQNGGTSEGKLMMDPTDGLPFEVAGLTFTEPELQSRASVKGKEKDSEDVPDIRLNIAAAEIRDQPNVDVPATRTRSKRKDSSASASMELSRGRRKGLEDVELADETEVPSTPSALSDPSKTSKERKRFQNVIYLLHSQISQHRSGNIFHNPIKESEAPDYHEIVKRPMDLKTVKARVRDGFTNSSREFQRDIYLMFANAMMYNRPNSDIYAMTEEMMLESEVNINTFRQTEGFARTRL